MLHTKYEGSRPCGFRQEEFFMFSIYNLCKTCDPGILACVGGHIRIISAKFGTNPVRSLGEDVL